MKINKLTNLQNNIKEIEGTNTHSLNEILTDDFLKKNTTFKSYNDMVEQSGLTLNETTYDELCENKSLNEYISKNTKYNSFEDICTEATVEFAMNKIMEGL